MQLNYWVWAHLRLGSLVSVFKSTAHQGIFTVYSSSNINFCILLGPVRNKGYYSNYPSFHALRYRFFSLSKWRGHFLDSGVSLLISGVNLGAEHKFTSYGALYLMTAGVSGANPVLSAWLTNNSEPHYRRATSVALTVLAFNSVCFGDAIL